MPQLAELVDVTGKNARMPKALGAAASVRAASLGPMNHVAIIQGQRAGRDDL